MPVRRKLIVQTVEELLSDHGITFAPVPVAKIAEALGIEVVSDNVDDELSGFLYREQGSGRTVIGVNGAHPLRRQRFTIAHELGHYLLHEGEAVHVDEEDIIFTMDFRDGRSSRGDNDNEREANMFAAELLMPARFLETDLAGQRFDVLDEDSALEELAEKYRVSVQALSIRLSNLNYITF